MQIWVITSEFSAGNRICGYLRENGCDQVAVLRCPPAENRLSEDSVLLIYQKTQITEWIRTAAQLQHTHGCRAILLLDPDKYARFLDAGRAADLTLLLMPVTCSMLSEALHYSRR
jgi:hypothetical protein